MFNNSLLPQNDSRCEVTERVAWWMRVEELNGGNA